MFKNILVIVVILFVMGYYFEIDVRGYIERSGIPGFLEKRFGKPFDGISTSTNENVAH